MGSYYFDIETYQQRKDGRWEMVRNANKFTLGCIWNGQDYKFFTDKKQMKNYIYKLRKLNLSKKKHTRDIFYAHNAMYDWIGLFREDILNLEFQTYKDYMLHAKNKQLGFEVVDTQLILKGSLAKVGESLGIEKLEGPKIVNSMDEVYDYLKRDVQIVKKIVEHIKELMKHFDYKPEYVTGAPQLARLNFKRYLEKKRNGYDLIQFWKTPRGSGGWKYLNTKDYEFVKGEMYGARCEAYKTGQLEDIYYVDQNSQYPWVVSNMQIPNMRTETILKDPLRYIKLNNLLSKYVGCAKVTLSVDNELGLLPVKYKRQVFYPNTGQLTGTYTLKEINHALHNGYELHNMEKAVFYKPSKSNPFKDYFNMLYKARQDNPEHSIIIKLLMNSLIGSFACDYMKTSETVDLRHKMFEMKNKGYKIKYEIGNKICYEYDEKHVVPNYNCINIYVQCLAGSRINMWNHLKKIPMDCRVYTDTDSVMMQGDFLNKFKLGNKMGQWKIVQEAVDAEIIKPKAYRVGTTYKISGLAKSEIAPGVLDRIKKGEVINHKMITLKEALRHGDAKKIGEFIEEAFTLIDKPQLELPNIMKSERFK